MKLIIIIFFQKRGKCNSQSLDLCIVIQTVNSKSKLHSHANYTIISIIMTKTSMFFKIVLKWKWAKKLTPYRSTLQEIESFCLIKTERIRYL